MLFLCDFKVADVEGLCVKCKINNRENILVTAAAVVVVALVGGSVTLEVGAKITAEVFDRIETLSCRMFMQLQPLSTFSQSSNMYQRWFNGDARKFILTHQ